MMPDKTYHPREVLRNQEKNRKQKYSAQTTGKNWKINRKISINDNIISELRTRFKEDHSTPLFISRGKVDLFLKCKRCFYFAMNLGFRRLKPLPLPLNNLVDACFKNDMDYCRTNDIVHPVFSDNNLSLKPFNPEDFKLIQEWRDDMKSFIGATYHYEKYNWLLCGIIDDVLVDDNGMLYIVDCKSTSKISNIHTFDDVSFGASLKIQLEWYSWLLNKMGYEVSKTAYLVYYNAIQDKHLEPNEELSLMRFRRSLVSVECNWDWIEATLDEMKECLLQDKAPEQEFYNHKGKERNACDDCSYLNTYQKLQ